MMKRVVIPFRVKSNLKTFYVMRLLKRFSGYVYAPVKRVSGSDVSVAKYVVSGWVKNDEVFVIFSTLASGKACKYYYHPKAHKWYKDIKEKDFPVVFNWL